ncbi:non-ribosomal peptide synthetase [Paenibacillus sp. 481]|uniref:non-ribosomal peptide synthetase n=1 Tax=Paenibacillus sp. 481 TaxID=2835869 RepID=UPI001E309599|nr:non-ribosomal peptide synthetase [Paenibacillus sp. 481]
MSNLYPLTHPQKRIWYVENMYPDTSIYNIGGFVKINGPVDFSLLEEAINEFIRQNDAIRIRIMNQDGTVQQAVTEYSRKTLPYIDLAASESNVGLEDWVSGEFAKPLPLDGEFLYDFALVKVSDTESAYLTKVHHIISDGWCFQLMTSQINQIYTQLMQGEEVGQQTRHTYLGYIEQEQKYLESSRFLKNKQFWQKKFEHVDNVDLHTSASHTTGRRKPFLLQPDTSEAIRQFAHAQSISLNTLFVAVMLLYLHKANQQDRIIIGTPVLNRTGVKEKNTFGMFTSTMPFLADIEHDMTYSTFMKSINQELLQCYFHQKYPYNMLVQDLELQKRGLDQLFQVCVNYYNTKYDSKFGPGWDMRQIEVHNGHQLYPLQLIVTEWSADEGLELYFDYKTGDYTEAQIDEMYQRLLYITNQIIGQPEGQIGELRLLSPEEREELLYGCNVTEQAYPSQQTIQQLFEEQVERSPDRISVSCKGRSLTYRQLNERANQLARTLQKSEMDSHKPVAIMARHSLEIVVGIWAVIKAGGAYLPIDPDYPKERIEYILRDSGASLLLTQGEEWTHLSYEGTVIALDDERQYADDKHNLPVTSKPDDLVYLIYTSGSTGNPKGAMIEHRGLVNYIWWANKTYIRASDDVFALYSSIAFDLTVTSIFTPLISGNRIEIYEDDGSEFILQRIIRDNKATVIKLTPAHLALMKDIDTRESVVRRFIVGGEDLKAALAADIYKQFHERIDIYNEYGPTETVVGCMIYRYDPESDKRTSVSIGKPIDNTQIYILDRHLEPVPHGAVGEIYISGDGVARGYLHRPELTQERFVDNPFIRGRSMYRTGDLAIRYSDGNISYLGRVDHQVKIKGYRIELGEIENQLLAIEAVEEVIVIDQTGDDGQQHLAAYYVAKRELTSLELRMKLTEVLPSYMIPAYFIGLDQLPLTPNGKVDRKLLPIPEPVCETSDTGEATAVEAFLAGVFADVLQVEGVGAHHHFYRMGGDSIKALQIASKINAAGYRLKVQDILSYPVIHELAALVERNAPRKVEQGLCEGTVRPLPITSWFFSRPWNNPHYFAQSVLIRLTRTATTEQLRDVLYALIQHHDALRLHYVEAEGCLAYRAVEQADVEVSSCDLASYPASERAAALKSSAEAFKGSVRLDEGLLIKALSFDMGEEGQRLLLTAHHLVVDGVSWRILLEDFDRLLQSALDGQVTTLPAKTDSLQAWAEAVETYSRERASEQSEYWQSVVNEVEHSLPVDRETDDDRHAICETLAEELSAEATHKLLGNANTAFHTQTSDLLVAALSLAVNDLTGKDKLTIELEGHGREEIIGDIDVSRTVGWFTSMYPVNLRLSGSEPAGAIKSVKEQLRSIPHKGIDYGILSYLSRRVAEPERGLIRFNYMGEIDNHLHSSVIDLAAEDAGSDICPSNKLTCLVDIVAMVIGKTLRVRMTYSTAKFSEGTMEGLMKTFMQRLGELIRFCTDQEQADFTPSDFETVKLSQDELDVLFN